MQQLLGDREAATDGAFILELFLQHLPTNVRMVLAPTADMISVEDLAQLDQIVEAATPSILEVAAPQREVEQLRAEVSDLS